MSRDPAMSWDEHCLGDVRPTAEEFAIMDMEEALAQKRAEREASYEDLFPYGTDAIQASSRRSMTWSEREKIILAFSFVLLCLLVISLFGPIPAELTSEDYIRAEYAEAVGP